MENDLRALFKQETCPLLAQANVRLETLDRRLSAWMVEAGNTNTKILYLLLWKTEPIGWRKIAQQIGVGRSQVYESLRVLIKRGWVQRVKGGYTISTT